MNAGSIGAVNIFSAIALFIAIEYYHFIHIDVEQSSTI